MGKPNTYVLLKNAQQQINLLHAEVERMKGFTLQQSLDMALITLNTEFGFGPERCAAFESAFRQTFMDYAGCAWMTVKVMMRFGTQRKRWTERCAVHAAKTF